MLNHLQVAIMSIPTPVMGGVSILLFWATVVGIALNLVLRGQSENTGAKLGK